MELSNHEILAVHRATKRPITECKQALVTARGDHDAARVILDAWSLGRPAPDGSVPDSWGAGDADVSTASTQRRCPKCWQEFSAIPDVVRCPTCQYEFRSSSHETPLYFALFTGYGPPHASDWLLGDQLPAVRRALARLGELGPPEEQRIMASLIEQLEADRDIVGWYTLLTGLQRARLRAVGELLAAMASGCDAIEEWITNWAAPVAARARGAESPPQSDPS